jgi:hypothetical protein
MNEVLLSQLPHVNEGHGRTKKVAKKCKILATFQKPTSDSGKLPFSVNRTRLEANVG